LNTAAHAYIEKKNMKCFGLSREDTRGKDDKRLRIWKGKQANPGLPEKWALNGMLVHV